MKDTIYYSFLYDYYGKLLTNKEKTYFEEYYFENLSLQEIAENHNVSKNAISKTLKEAKEKLTYYENILHLYNNSLKIKSLLDQDAIKKIEKYI